MSEQPLVYMASCIEVNVYYKQFHTGEPFNFGAISQRIRILLHKAQPNQNPEKRNRNRTEQIVSHFSFISVTRDSPN